MKVPGAEPASSAERPVDRRVGGGWIELVALNIFAGAGLTDEVREELELKRREAIRIEEQNSNAMR